MRNAVLCKLIPLVRGGRARIHASVSVWAPSSRLHRAVASLDAIYGGTNFYTFEALPEFG